MHDILRIIELFLAILGAYYLLLKLLAAIIYRKLMAKVAEAKDSETSGKINDINPPKYTITDSCPICDSIFRGINIIYFSTCFGIFSFSNLCH